MNKLRKYGVIFKVSIQNQLAYMTSFISGFVFYAFVIFIFMNLWKVIYSDRGIISGFSYQQVIWYCIITEMIVMSAGGGVFADVSGDIKNGNIGYYLNKPYNYIFYNFANSMGLVALKFIFNALIGTAMGLLFVGRLEDFNFLNLPLIILGIVLGIFLSFLLYSLVGLLAFWFEENSAFFWVLQKILFMGGLFFPLDMMPGWLKSLALMLPFSYVTYAPAKLFTRFSLPDFTWMTGVQVFYIALLLALNLLIYRKGVKAVNVNGG